MKTLAEKGIEKENMLFEDRPKYTIYMNNDVKEHVNRALRKVKATRCPTINKVELYKIFKEEFGELVE